MSNIVVEKAVILATEYGTRFLPTKKAMTKEILPIFDKSTIQHNIKDTVQCGIKDILIATGKGKRAIEDYFESVSKLEEQGGEKKEFIFLKLIEKTRSINIHFIRQSKPMGLFFDLYQAKAFIGNESFIVMLGDNIVQAGIPCTKQLIGQYNKTKSSIIGVRLVSHKVTQPYRNIVPQTSKENISMNVIN